MAGLIYGIVVFYSLAGALKTPRRLKIAVLVFLAAGLMLAVVGFLGRLEYQEPFFAPIKSKLPKIPHVKLGLTGAEAGINPNPLGGILLLFIPIGILQIPLLMKKNDKNAAPVIKVAGFVGMVVILGVQALAVTLSTSFGTWFALALALWLMGERKRTIKAIIALVFLSIIVLFSLRTSAPGNSDNQGIRGAIYSSLNSRVEIWKKGLETAKTHPLLGIGIDRLRRIPKFHYEDPMPTINSSIQRQSLEYPD